MSLANLAAFGGVALLPQLRFDYSILFTSLSLIQIMLTPLLSIIQMLPDFFSAFMSWKRIRDYVTEGADEGKHADPKTERRGNSWTAATSKQRNRGMDSEIDISQGRRPFCKHGGAAGNIGCPRLRKIQLPESSAWRGPRQSRGHEHRRKAPHFL